MSSGRTGAVAIYARLSVNENGERDESLATQVELLKHWARENDLHDSIIYRDNDISGTCFDRPGLARLRSDIENERVKTVLVKDLSRLGRNNGETLVFLDYLKEKGVRLIAPGDNYDSFRDDDDTIGIRTWVNEYYARDISKKVRSNLRKKIQGGEYLGSPPFGYRKSSQEKNRLVVDERYRDIIQEIFDLYIKGWGYRALAEHVQGLGIPTPSRDKGYIRTPKSERWNEQHIRRIIANRVYCGDTVQGVSEKLSFKSRKTRRLPEDKWIIIPGTHEAIISRETWELARQVRLKRCREGSARKRSNSVVPHLFTGFIVCARCGTNHVYRKKRNREAAYICGRYNRFGRNGCTSHHVAEEKLLRYIIHDIQNMSRGVSFQHRLIEKYRQNKFSGTDMERKIVKLKDEISTKKKQLQAVYLDKIRGVIAEELFFETYNAIEKEIYLLTGRLKQLKEEQKGVQNMEAGIKDVHNMELQLEPGDIDRAFLEKYINKIIVSEEGEGMAPEVQNMLKLESILTAEKIAGMAGDKCRIIIWYDLAPR